jgi:hypothetical protein
MIFNLVNPYNILKLNVVSGTIPLGYAPEGTVFVQTDVPHTSYVYSSKTPANPTQGMIWLKHEDTVNYPILAFEKRAVDSSTSSAGNFYAYPGAVYQYVNGAWVNKTYYIYNEHGENENLNYYMMQNGRFNQLYDWGQWVPTGPDGERKRKIQFQGGIFHIPDQSGYYSWGYTRSIKEIDVTNFKNMHVNIIKSVHEELTYSSDSFRVALSAVHINQQLKFF